MDWFVYKHALQPKIEPHKRLGLSLSEIKRDLKNHKSAFFALYYSNFDKSNTDRKQCEAWFVIKDKFGGMDELSSNTRTQVRKSLKMCEVRKISKQELASDDGYEVLCSHDSKFTSNIISKQRFFDNISKMNEEEFFGVFDKETNKLICFFINLVGEAVLYSSAKANVKYLKSHYPFYAGFYEMERYYLQDQNKKYVADGFRSLDNHSNIQNLLIEKFKYRKAFCSVNIVYRWYVKVAVCILYPFRNFVKYTNVKKMLQLEYIRLHS